MVVDQDEINELKAQAEAAETVAVAKPESAADAQEAAQTSAAPNEAPDTSPDEEVARLMKIRVPVIVQLATREMAVKKIRHLSAGAIIEFDKSVTEGLDLLINNRLVGRGTAVKIGEHFGLEVTDVGDTAQRIKSLGS